MKEKGFLKDFWENLEEYLCSAALLVMTFVTFMNVFSRKITWFNMSFTQELVTTMFVWVCCLAAASVFKTDSHMGFNYLTDKFTGTGRKVYRICRLLLCSANYGIWIIWGGADGLQAVSLPFAYRCSGDASVDHRNRHSFVSGFLHRPYGTV